MTFSAFASHKDPEIRELHFLLRVIFCFIRCLLQARSAEKTYGGRQLPTDDQVRSHQERLVMHNLRLVVWLAYRCTRMGFVAE